MGYARTVQHDADGQHDPTAIEPLLAAMDDEKADIMIGARFAGVGKYRVRGPRKWSMRLLSLVLSRVAHTRLTDTTSGFKACNEGFEIGDGGERGVGGDWERGREEV